MRKQIHLLAIDPQNDFCDPQNGSLYVQGAENDMTRVADMVKRISTKLDDIHVTLDSHHMVHIANPIFWAGTDGKPPNPFTLISASDVKAGVWSTKVPSFTKKAIEYLEKLEATGKYVHCIWPVHCTIGSWGHGVFPVLFEALSDWEREFAIIDYVTKGSNVWTEHFSAVQAEVPMPDDPTTQVNTRLIETLEKSDEIVICGEAGSHCLRHTVTDIANNFSDAGYVQKLVLLEDCTSPVPSFESAQDDFINEMTQRGMRLEKSTTYLK